MAIEVIVTTLREINVAPENRPSQKETHLPTIHSIHGYGICLPTHLPHKFKHSGREIYSRPMDCMGMLVYWKVATLCWVP